MMPPSIPTPLVPARSDVSPQSATFGLVLKPDKEIFSSRVFATRTYGAELDVPLVLVRLINGDKVLLSC